MRINKSPWIHQLNPERKLVALAQDIDTDIVIVGAGIAGISTAFFTLKYTTKRVVIVERGKLAHGATGHNAGQVIARFERPLAKIVKEFGFEKTKKALHDLHSGWVLIDEMYTDANLDIPFARITGTRGYSDLHQVILALKDLEIEHLAGLPTRKMLVSEKAPFKEMLPKVMSSYYELVPHEDVLRKLETEDKQFHAVMFEQAACVNSALFCQEIAAYLIKKYPNRFSLYENTPILKVVLREKNIYLDALKHTLHAEKVVLCTNGFEDIEIHNEGGLAIDKKFHHLVNGRVGYMSGYLEKMNKTGAAISYYVKDNDPFDDHPDPYFYLTRRVHEMEDQKHNLVCVGGPEVEIPDRKHYHYDYEYPETHQREIEKFIKTEYDSDPNKKIDYQFTWHGLMGYTPNRIRLIGEEPKNRALLYNLGCNGIGIIPSVFGGRKISKILAGERQQASVFDPRG